MRKSILYCVHVAKIMRNRLRGNGGNGGNEAMIASGKYEKEKQWFQYSRRVNLD